MVVPRQVDRREQQIADLRFNLIERRIGDLVQLFQQLGADIFNIVPVKSDPLRPLLELFGAGERRQRQGDARQCRVIATMRFGALGGLDLVPAWRRLAISPEHMGVASDHLATNS